MKQSTFCSLFADRIDVTRTCFPVAHVFGRRLDGTGDGKI